MVALLWLSAVLVVLGGATAQPYVGAGGKPMCWPSWTKDDTVELHAVVSAVYIFTLAFAARDQTKSRHAVLEMPHDGLHSYFRCGAGAVSNNPDYPYPCVPGQGRFLMPFA